MRWISRYRQLGSISPFLSTASNIYGLGRGKQMSDAFACNFAYGETVLALLDERAQWVSAEGPEATDDATP